MSSRKGNKHRHTAPRGNTKITQFFTSLIPRKQDEPDELMDTLLKRSSSTDNPSAVHSSKTKVSPIASLQVQTNKIVLSHPEPARRRCPDDVISVSTSDSLTCLDNPVPRVKSFYVTNSKDEADLFSEDSLLGESSEIPPPRTPLNHHIKPINDLSSETTPKASSVVPLLSPEPVPPAVEERIQLQRIQTVAKLEDESVTTSEIDTWDSPLVYASEQTSMTDITAPMLLADKITIALPVVPESYDTAILSSQLKESLEKSTSKPRSSLKLNFDDDSDDDDIVLTAIGPDLTIAKILESEKEFDFSVQSLNPTSSEADPPNAREFRSRRSTASRASLDQLPSRHDLEERRRQRQINSTFKDLESILRKNEKQMKRLDTMTRVFSESENAVSQDEMASRHIFSDDTNFSDVSKSIVVNLAAAQNEGSADIMHSLLDESSTNPIITFVEIFDDQRVESMTDLQFPWQSVSLCDEKSVNHQFLQTLHSSTALALESDIESKPAKKRKRCGSSPRSPRQIDRDGTSSTTLQESRILHKVFHMNLIGLCMSQDQFNFGPIVVWLMSLVSGARNEELVEEAFYSLRKILFDRSFVHTKTRIPISAVEDCLKRLGISECILNSSATISDFVTQRPISPEDDKEEKIQGSLLSCERIHCFLEVLKDIVKAGVLSDEFRLKVMSLVTKMGCDPRLVGARRTIQEAITLLIHQLDTKDWESQVSQYAQDMLLFLGRDRRIHGRHVLSIWQASEPDSRLAWLSQRFAASILGSFDDLKPVSFIRDNHVITVKWIVDIISEDGILSGSDHGRSQNDYSRIRDTACLLWYVFSRFSSIDWAERGVVKSLCVLLRRLYSSIPDSRSISLERVEAKHEVMELSSAVEKLADRHKSRGNKGSAMSKFFVKNDK